MNLHHFFYFSIIITFKLGQSGHHVPCSMSKCGVYKKENDRLHLNIDVMIFQGLGTQFAGVKQLNASDHNAYQL